MADHETTLLRPTGEVRLAELERATEKVMGEGDGEAVAWASPVWTGECFAVA